MVDVTATVEVADHIQEGHLVQEDHQVQVDLEDQEVQMDQVDQVDQEVQEVQMDQEVLEDQMDQEVPEVQVDQEVDNTAVVAATKEVDLRATADSGQTMALVSITIKQDLTDQDPQDTCTKLDLTAVLEVSVVILW